jgi:CheY-like chemotaxis protein
MPSPRVLVVDDAEAIRRLVAQALRQHGFEVLLAESGPEALRMAIDARPAIAVVDQWMPGMTGAELIRILRAVPLPEVRAMPIVGLSGRGGSERELLAAGAATFVAKPFGELDLVAAVRAALGLAAAASGAA